MKNKLLKTILVIFLFAPFLYIYPSKTHAYQPIIINDDQVVNTIGDKLFGLQDLPDSFPYNTNYPLLKTIYNTLKINTIETSGRFTIVPKEPLWHLQYVRCDDFDQKHPDWLPNYIQNSSLFLLGRDEPACKNRATYVYQLINPDKFIKDVSYSFQVEIKRDNLQSWDDQNPVIVKLTHYHDDGTTDNIDLLSLPPGSDSDFKTYTFNYLHQPKEGKTIKKTSLSFWINKGSLITIKNPALIKETNIIADPTFQTVSYWQKDRIYKQIDTNYHFDRNMNLISYLGAKPFLEFSTKYESNSAVYALNVSSFVDSFSYLKSKYPHLEYFAINNELFEQINPSNWAQNIKPLIDKIKTSYPNSKISIAGYLAREIKPNNIYNQLFTALGDDYVKKLYAISYKYYPLSALIISQITPSSLIDYTWADWSSKTDHQKSSKIQYIDEFNNYLEGFILSSANPDLKIFSIQHASLGRTIDLAQVPSLTLADALWYAELLGRYSYHQKLELSTKFKGVAKLNQALIEPTRKTPYAPESYNLRPAFYTYYLFANYFGDKIITVENPLDPTNFSAFAAKDDQNLYVLVINRKSTPATLPLQFKNISKANISVYRISAPSIDSSEVSINGKMIKGNSLASFQSSLNSIPNLPPGQNPPTIDSEKRLTLDYPAYTATFIKIAPDDSQSAILKINYQSINHQKGQILLSELKISSSTTEPITLKNYPTYFSPEKNSYILKIDLNKYPPGEYDLLLTGPLHLKTKFTKINLQKNTTTALNKTLLAGDLNHDNKIDDKDLTILKQYYNFPTLIPNCPAISSTGFNCKADLDKNNKVNARDFSTLIKNYNKAGDN